MIGVLGFHSETERAVYRGLASVSTMPTEDEVCPPLPLSVAGYRHASLNVYIARREEPMDEGYVPLASLLSQGDHRAEMRSMITRQGSKTGQRLLSRMVQRWRVSFVGCCL